ncbi:hypothetical protein PTKIN_Ptkin04bG0014800 [Pterospermum kingtungense]
MVVKGHAKTSHGDTIRAQPVSNYSSRRGAGAFAGDILAPSNPLFIHSLTPPAPLSWFRPRLSPGIVVKDHTETSHGLRNTIRAKPGSNYSRRLRICRARRDSGGCENDVYIVKKMLVELYGYSDSSILILTENQADPDKYPTKSKIMNALNWLVHGCGSQDSLVFYFSGHGFRNSRHNLELCPSDYESGPDRTIVDDELNETIIKPLPQGAKLHLIIDACNSGNAIALPYRYKMHRRQGGHWNMYPHQLMRNGTNGGEAIPGYETGAMTFALVKAIFEKQPHPITYEELLHKIICTVRKVKGKKGGRLKQLTSNKPFGVGNKIFTL